jgi:hypothetical protein
MYIRAHHAFLLYGQGVIASKTMSEAFLFRPQSVLGYAIYNNLLGAHGWSRVRVLAQKTSDNKMLDKIKRRVGQMKRPTKWGWSPKYRPVPKFKYWNRGWNDQESWWVVHGQFYLWCRVFFFWSGSGIASWTEITVAQIGIEIWMAET